MSVTDEIKQRIDIIELIGESVALRKAGRTFVGFCPFHSNTRTPAFTVYPDSQSYHCFGCKASGTAFDFVMARQGLDFPQALRQLAQRAGVQLEERQEAEQQSRLRTRLLDANSAAATFFTHLLRTSSKGEEGRAYLAKRELTPASVESFGLGFAPDEWSLLLAYLTDEKGFETGEIEQAGLAIRRDSGGFYDRFRGRLMFPIRDAQGAVVGFGGRAIGDAQPKYMNTPQTPLFDKSSVLYGLDLAREAIRSEGAAVIVEGYVDVITAYQHGFKNVVAPLGTALTDSHIRLLKRFSKRVLLALDADPAGQRAMLKGLEKIQGAGDDTHAVATTAGLIRWESDVELRVIALPAGQDPDEVIGQNPAHWKQLVAEAQPVMEFYLQAYTADLDLSAARDQAQAIERLLPLLAGLPEAEQRVYVGRIERMLPDVRAELIIDMLRRTPRQEEPAKGNPRQRTGTTPPGASYDPNATSDTTVAAKPAPLHAEEQLLALLLRHPPARKGVEEKLAGDLASFPLVRQLLVGTLPELFERVENRLLWESWCAQPAGRLVGGWMATLPPELAEHGSRVVALAPIEQADYRDTRAATDYAIQLQTRLAMRWQLRIAQQLGAGDEANQQTLLAQLVDVQQYFARIKQPPRSSTWNDLQQNRG